MPRSVTCMVMSRQITIEEALGIRAIQAPELRKPITQIACVECAVSPCVPTKKAARLQPTLSSLN